MSTLLLRLAGPLQSWGVSSKYDIRMTGREPSKSGVIGMIAAALGRRRDEPIDDLANLRFGVRVDQEGIILHDFHTAHSDKDSFVTYRYYLADAVFLVGLEGDFGLLSDIEKAIQSPVFPLFLGRRSCPPSGRVCLGIRDGDLISSLKSEGWVASDWYKRKHKQITELEIVMDSQDGAGIEVRDMPISFSQSMRQHAFRNVSRDVRGCIIEPNDDETSTKQDPFDIIGGS